jgi:polar amino acid transport system permease protein
MSELTSSSKAVSLLQEVKAHVGTIPLVRQNRFLYGALAFTVLFGVFLLPPASANLTTIQSVCLGIFILLTIGWAYIFITDECKPDSIKIGVSLVVVVLSAWLFYRYSSARWGEMTGLFLNLEIMKKATPRMIEGLGVTIEIAIFSALMSTTLGLLLAVFRSFNNRVLNIFIVAYIDFFRAMPILVLLMLIYYALPYLGITLDAVPSGILALGLNSSAYVSEIFRAGILSVKKGQLEAARALGLTPMQTMRFVLLPQALRVVLPPLVGNYVSSAKDTALCSSISIIELLKAGLSEQAMLVNPSPLIYSTVLYLVLFIPLTRLATYLEVRMKRSMRRASL